MLNSQQEEDTFLLVDTVAVVDMMSRVAHIV
jgi:hypothetical protein